MKELCIDVRMAFHSGIGTYIRNVVPGLANFFKLRLICHPKLVDKWPFLRQCDLILTSSPVYSLQEQIILPYLIPPCDFFWAPHYNLPLAPLRAKKKIVTIHDVYHLVGPFSHLKRLYANLMIKRAAKTADRVITVSNFSKSELIRYTQLSENKLSVIHLGVDPIRFSRSNSMQQIKIKYQLPDRYFLYVGNLAPHKNIGRLLLAWNLLEKKIPDKKLVCVGGKTPLHVQVILKKHPFLKTRTLFLNDVLDDDLPSLYTQAEAMIHPSLYEGFGLTLLEAMSCGCPTIVSHAASLPEVCLSSALYVNPYCIEEMAGAMEKMSQDSELRTEMRKKGQERSRTFTWEKTLEAHLEVFR